MRKWALLLAIVVMAAPLLMFAWNRESRGGPYRAVRGEGVESKRPIEPLASLPSDGVGAGSTVQSATLIVRVIDPLGSPLSAVVSGAQADAEGRTVLTLKPSVQHVVDIRHQGFGPARIHEELAPGERRERVVRLYAGQTVNVRVESELTGKPVEGVRLTLGVVSWATDALYPRGRVTNANGVATWSHIPPGLVVIRTAEQTLRFMFELRSDTTGMPIVIKLSRAGAAAAVPESDNARDSPAPPRGSATQALTKPSAATSITGRCVPPQPVVVWLEGMEGREADTTESGRFSFREELNPTGSYTLHYRRPGPFQATHVLEGVRVGQEAVIRFPPTGELAVRCVDPRGRPVCKALASIRLDDKSSDAVMVESADGVLRFRALQPGRHALWLARRGYELLGPVPFQIVPGGVTDVSLQFKRLLPVLGVRVRDVAGRPMAGCRVRVSNEEGEVPNFGRHPNCSIFRSLFPDETNSDGRCFFPVPAEGPYVVELSVNMGLLWHPFARREIQVGSAGEWNGEFVLRWQVEVIHVEPDSPVYRAGLRKRDVVRLWNGRKPTNSEEMVSEKMVSRLESVLSIVSRDGRQRDFRFLPRRAQFEVNWMPVREGY